VPPAATELRLRLPVAETSISVRSSSSGTARGSTATGAEERRDSVALFVSGSSQRTDCQFVHDTPGADPGRALPPRAQRTVRRAVEFLQLASLNPQLLAAVEVAVLGALE
jgi:hypothetical protein